MTRVWLWIGAIALILIIVCAMQPKRVVKEMCIDANVYSDNFGNEVPCS